MATTQVTVNVGPTMLDIAKANGSDGIAGLIDQTIRVAPELQIGFARTIKGQNYKTLVRTALPAIGFRDANQGMAGVKSTYENKMVETFILDPKISVDKAVADQYEDGAEAYIALEADAIMKAALQLLGKTFYYGKRYAYTGDSNPNSATGKARGFYGLLDFVDSSLIYDCQGSAVGTSNWRTSVWGVKFGPADVAWVYGEDGQLAMLPTRVGDAPDANGNFFTAYISQLMAYPGLQMVQQFSVGRIKNITDESTHGLTDKVLGSWLAQFPAAYTPDVIFASRKAIESLRASRTATNVTGTPAPSPTDYEGIPIVKTDSLSAVEGSDIA
ncbi:MAG TPA: hypothetical protein VHQ47_17885 [Phycisphaerae bacterium]|nr:hypothetical protein [Phycisphaerae bacterium]